MHNNLQYLPLEEVRKRSVWKNFWVQENPKTEEKKYCGMGIINQLYRKWGNNSNMNWGKCKKLRK